MLISIITITLNNLETLKQTISSVQSQSFKEYEYIVIDGNSQDGTVEYLAQFPITQQFKWISEPDNGIADAMNKGFLMSKGDYIIFLHSDDFFYSPITLEKIHNILIHNNIDIYAASIILNSKSGSGIIKKPIRLLWWNNLRYIIKHQGTVTHRRVFETVGLFDTKYKISMDYDFFFRAIKNKHSIIFSNEIISVMGPDGISNSPAMISKRLKEDFQIQKMHLNGPLWKCFKIAFHSIYYLYKAKKILR